MSRHQFLITVDIADDEDELTTRCGLFSAYPGDWYATDLGTALELRAATIVDIEDHQDLGNT